MTTSFSTFARRHEGGHAKGAAPYDTHNILNTDDETVNIPKVVAERARQHLERKGLLVVGLAGFEKSIHTFVDSLGTPEANSRGLLEYGLLWGVYAGNNRPTRPSQAVAERAVRQAIAADALSPEVVRFIQDRVGSNVPFAFFPVWGGGSFMWQLLNRSGKSRLVRRAEPYLDHDLRVREVFKRKGLSTKAQDEHLKRLKQAHAGNGGPASPSPAPDRAFEIAFVGRQGRLSVSYGDISVACSSSSSNGSGHTSAVVSPEDTCLSIGGGAALSIAEAAGLRTLIHELSKFAPIPPGTAVVTSGCQIPANYIIHAAGVDITDRGPHTDSLTVGQAIASAVARCQVLSVSQVWIPLVGAGVMRVHLSR